MAEAKRAKQMTSLQEQWLECCIEAQVTGRECFEFPDGDLYAVIGPKPAGAKTSTRKPRARPKGGPGTKPQRVALVKRRGDEPLCVLVCGPDGTPQTFEDKTTREKFTLPGA
jgi:hypothetical protein